MTWPSLLDIRTRERSLLNEPVFILWPDAELNRLSNDAERDIAIKTGCIESIDTVMTTASSRLVAVSGYRVKYVEYVSGSERPKGLARITIRQMGFLGTNGALPQYWCQWGRYILVDPLPVAAHTLNVYMADWPQVEMSADADTPEIPAEFHNLIPAYAYWKALLKIRKFGSSGAVYLDYIGALQRSRSQLLDRYPDQRADLKIPDRIEIRRPQER